MLFYFFIFIFGAIIGSFLNVVILRLQAGEKLSGRSRCPHCRKNLAAVDLIPLFSFFWQKGKCRYCQKKISWQYPAVELATGLLFALATYNIFGGSQPALLFYDFRIFWGWLRDLVFISFLVVIFVYDLRWQLILDKVTMPAMAAALILNLWLGYDFFNLLGAAFIGLAVFGIQFAVSRGRWVGGGDLRLGFLMGLMLGWPQIVPALFLAYVIGAAVSLALVALGRKKFKHQQIAFGTFLSLGTLVALWWGQEIVIWYLSFL